MRFSLLLLLAATTALLHVARAITGEENTTACRNVYTDFSALSKANALVADASPQDTFQVNNKDGLKMTLVPPTDYQRLIDPGSMLPYNNHIGRGPTFNSTHYMHFGRFSSTVKSSRVGGTITAMILMGDGGDEIDFEIIGSAPHTVETNYFWGQHKEYNVNGGSHDIPGDPVYDQFHTYTIDWSPERIEWSVDNRVIRVTRREDTCDQNGVCKYPSEPARIQIGFWDGSFEFGTAQWSKGPIDWEKQGEVAAYLKQVRIECDPKYNKIVEDGTSNGSSLVPGPPTANDTDNPSKWKPKSDVSHGKSAALIVLPSKPSTAISYCLAISLFFAIIL